ncbi:iron-containing redox enzyme family protein [Nocardioides aequoreus]|uniref:iron-containing redox enzyme family protein n=1 Tax=Nocardioides aequoreus TaxID=397278 RepID=UPI000B06C621|nr:iron-containing redox enzyme family protein [Nocardioides aequoreus]
MTHLPRPRGELTARLVETLRGPLDGPPLTLGGPAPDASLALWMLHELHYRGFDEVDDRWEWSPRLMPLRRDLEDDLERRLRERYAGVATYDDLEVDEAVVAVIDDHEGPSLARHVQRHATRQEVEELLRQRSIYHLKEADPTSWTIPRLSAGPKAALLLVQLDEYGAGDPARLHHALFAQGLADSGLDAAYGAYVDEATDAVLEQNNAVSLFGLQRRMRGAALGHFAAFEATSSIPSRQLAQGMRRVGLPESMAGYYDEHVEADAAHEQVALRDICGRLVREEPALRDDVLLGAWTCLDLEARTARDLLGRWEAVAA